MGWRERERDLWGGAWSDRAWCSQVISVQYLGFKWSSVSHILGGIVTTPVDEGFIDGMCVLQGERESERDSLPQCLGLKGKSGLFLKVPYLSGLSLLP